MLIVMVPRSFSERTVRILGEAGRSWIARLPERLDELAAEWGLRIDAPVPNLSYNYVAPATDADGVPWMLKLNPAESAEGDREPLALRAYRGEGAVRLGRHDARRRAMLLERVAPGDDLRTFADPEAAQIAADVLARLWEAKPAEGLAELGAWTATLDRFVLAPGPIPRDFVDRAAGLRRDLLASPPERVLLHGDLHHANVLRSETRGWLAIDPKGVVGEKAYDVPAFLLNPGPVPLAATRARVDAFVGRLGLERERVVAWSFVQAVVSVCWAVEDGETGETWWKDALAFAEDVLRLGP
jgi:streptomycin 6-kinase